MKSKTAGKVLIIYDPAEEATADIISGACEEAIRLARENWGLKPPEDCRIHVMTSGLGFVFQSAPWAWRILLAATIPFWFLRVRRTWPYSAAWTQRYGRRVAIGVKPPRLLARSDRSIGVRMFVEEKDMAVNVRNVTCHELVHACSAGLNLPMWLTEGIATVTVDRFMGRPTIRHETLAFLRDYAPKGAPPTYRELSRMEGGAIAYHTMRGYWLVRYLEEKRPGFLSRMFSERQDANAIEREMTAGLGMTPGCFWRDIDGLIAGHFEGRGAGTG